MFGDEVAEGPRMAARPGAVNGPLFGLDFLVWGPKEGKPCKLGRFFVG